MLSEKLAKHSLIRDDKFIDDEKNRRETESPSKRMKPSPSGNESDFDEDEVRSEVDEGQSASSSKGTTSEEAYAAMDRAASPFRGLVRKVLFGCDKGTS